MGARPRPKPERLSAKLRQIRARLRLSQSQIARRLDDEMSPARISEYEHGTREPSLLTLLAYARVARVAMETIVDDRVNLPQRFR